MRIQATFSRAIEAAQQAFVNSGYKVHSEKWQGMDIAAKPDMEMVEVLNHDFCCAMPTSDLAYYRNEIKPNLPWADDHFLERVAGQPLNPGVQWANWPYAKSADTHRTYLDGPVRSPADWAYLAGLIDGEGSIGIRQHDFRPYPRIKITQIDHSFLQSVHSRFPIGTLTVGNPSKLSENEPLVWRISSREEVRWVLTGTLPYLGLKKQRAIEALAALPNGDRRFNDPSTARLKEPMFSHTYMQRYWPRTDDGRRVPGLMFEYGDLRDVVELLKREPLTRQAFLPVWFPEDTGVRHGGRVPCSIGYHFMMRGGYFHVGYWLRSCDFVRHFRDDIYLTVRLGLWVLDKLRELDAGWANVKPGFYSMWMTSLHMFVNDYRVIFGKTK